MPPPKVDLVWTVALIALMATFFGVAFATHKVWRTAFGIFGWGTLIGLFFQVQPVTQLSLVDEVVIATCATVLVGAFSFSRLKRWIVGNPAIEDLEQQIAALKKDRDERALADKIAPKDLMVEAVWEAKAAGLEHARDQLQQRIDAGLPSSQPSAIATNLRLQFNGGGALPTAVSLVNIWRWYALVGSVQEFNNSGHPREVFRYWTIFVTFDKPVAFRQIIIRGHGADLPDHEVKTSDPRSAVIVIMGDSPGLILDIVADV